MSQDRWSEDLIIRACLAPDDELATLFDEFGKLGSLDHLNSGVVRLLPYLYRRLEKIEITAPQLGVVKGVYVKSWYQHQVSRRKTLDTAMDALSDIEFLVLKGFALQALVYNSDPPTRPGDDVDILVRPEQREEALDRFLKLGFVMGHTLEKEHALTLKPSVSLVRGDEYVDLHWALYPTTNPGSVVRDLFTRFVLCDNRGQSFATASVTDHLVHGLVHGSAKNEVSPIRWVLDCSLLLKHPDCDLKQLVTTSEDWGWSRIVGRQLGRLEQEFNIPVDSEIVAMLKRNGSPLFIRFFQWSRNLQPSPGRKILAVLLINGLYLRENTPARRMSILQWATFGAWLRAAIALRRPGQVAS